MQLASFKKTGLQGKGRLENPAFFAVLAAMAKIHYNTSWRWRPLVVVSDNFKRDWWTPSLQHIPCCCYKSHAIARICRRNRARRCLAWVLDFNSLDCKSLTLKPLKGCFWDKKPSDPTRQDVYGQSRQGRLSPAACHSEKRVMYGNGKCVSLCMFHHVNLILQKRTHRRRYK